MYIPFFVIAMIACLALCYSIWKYIRTTKVLGDLVASYNRTTLTLISCILRDDENRNDKKSLNHHLDLFSKAVVEAATTAITNHSLLQETDILSMCEIFQRDFKMRNRLKSPDPIEPKSYDKVIETMEDAVKQDIIAWFDFK